MTAARARHAFQETDVTGYATWAFSTSEVKKGLLSMPNDTSPGPSGLTVRSLKKAAATEEGASAIATIVNRIVNGQEKNTCRLLGATLVPLVKTETKVRPIAVGEVLTRLGAKMLLKNQVKELSRFLHPLQMGVKQPAESGGYCLLSLFLI